MATTEQILERREKVRKSLIEGFSQRSIAKALGVGSRTIAADVRGIQKQIKIEMKSDQREEFLMEFMLKYDDIYKKAANTYNNEANPNAKIGALRVMQSHFKEKVAILQSLGLIEKLPEKLDVTGRTLTEHEAILIAAAEYKKLVEGKKTNAEAIV